MTQEEKDAAVAESKTKEFTMDFDLEDNSERNNRCRGLPYNHS